MSEAASAISKVSNDIIIITKDHEEIHTNKYLLSTFSSIIGPLLSFPANDVGPLNLPECSSSSLKYLINVITSFILLENVNNNMAKLEDTKDDLETISVSRIEITTDELALKNIITNVPLKEEAETMKLDKIDLSNGLDLILKDKVSECSESFVNVHRGVILHQKRGK